MIKVTTCFALLTLLCAQVPSFANEPVRICYEQWSPFAETRDEKPHGIQIAIMQGAFDRVSIPVEFFEMPYVRCLPSVKTGEFDAILASSNETDLLPMTISVLRWELRIFVHEDYAGAEWTSLDEFAGKQAGVVAGYDYGHEIEDRFIEWDVQETPDAVFNLRKLAKQRIDFTIADSSWAQTVIRKEDLPIKALAPTIMSVAQYSYFHPKHADVITKIEAALLEMKEDGGIDEIYRHHTGSAMPHQWLAQ